uniref:Uncharacterized protein n=1 Tax=Opuntia streptacantha TaxID=393608 RepID=A0A7C8ZGW1_OPUST
MEHFTWIHHCVFSMQSCIHSNAESTSEFLLKKLTCRFRQSSSLITILGMTSWVPFRPARSCNAFLDSLFSSVVMSTTMFHFWVLSPAHLALVVIFAQLTDFPLPIAALGIQISDILF